MCPLQNLLRLRVVKFPIHRFTAKFYWEAMSPYFTLILLLASHTLCYEFQPSLGQQYIDFPTSTTNITAQNHFICGIANIHIFEYMKAFTQFKSAYTIDPSFALAYVFANLTAYKPIWMTENPTVGWEQIQLMNSRIRYDNITSVEKVFVNAARKLYHHGKMNTDNYISTLTKYYIENPMHIELSLFLVCALFSHTQPELRGYVHRLPQDRVMQMKILNDVLKMNPNHPGALHYSIHVYDTPETALVALPYSLKLPRIAPQSPHARHMPTHIYLRLGLYKQALHGNYESDLAGVNSVALQGNGDILTHRQFHTIEFVHYILLNMGRYTSALQYLESFRSIIDRDPFYKMQYGIMYDRHAVETKDYNFVFENPFDIIVCHECTTAGDVVWMYQINSGLLLAKGFATVKNSERYNKTLVQQYVQQIDEMANNINTTFPTLSTALTVMVLELKAFHEFYKGDKILALSQAKKASEIELSINPPCYGPPIDPVKPSQELYAELLLESGQYRSAITEFEQLMTYFPNRTHALVGLARSHAALDENMPARKYYQILLDDMLYGADFGYWLTTEASDYLHEHPASQLVPYWATILVITLSSFSGGVIVTSLVTVITQWISNLRKRSYSAIQ
jgi:tetratricopeptide (TPR) repeat protein